MGERAPENIDLRYARRAKRRRRFWWFRIGLPLLWLLLLAIGALTGVGLGVPFCLSFPTGYIVLPLLYNPRSWGNWPYMTAFPIAVMAQWAVIGYVIDRIVAPPLDPRRCPRCGYDIRGLPEPRCPECGGAVTLLDASDKDGETPS